MSKTYWWNGIKEQKINNAFSNIVIPDVSKPEEVDYNKIDNKPSINNVELKGNKSLDSLGAASKEYVDDKIAEALGDIETLLAAI